MMSLPLAADGALEVPRDRVLTFPSGLYGFRVAKHFAVFAIDGVSDALRVLRSLDFRDLRFLIAAPEIFFPDYQPSADPVDLEEVQLQDTGNAVWMLIVSFPDGQVRKAVANLRAPLLINPFTRLGKQVILQEDYPLREPLFRLG